MKQIFAALTLAPILLTVGCVTTSGKLPPPTPIEVIASEILSQSQPLERVRVVRNEPPGHHGASPRHIMLFALPNGNSIEWTAGRRMAEGLDWHYDIQHIAAQTRYLRHVAGFDNLVCDYLEATPKSWPLWRREVEDANSRIRVYTEALIAAEPPGSTMTLTGHSGGGSYTFGFIDAADAIPDFVTRIAFLDSNYGFSADNGHGTKIATWLRRNPQNQLVVLAYDDRYIELDGRRVVSDTGGTYRATLERMLPALEAEGITLSREEVGPWIIVRSPDGRIDIRVHKNPENRILHTVLVGEMNGLIHAMTAGGKHADPDQFLHEARVYTEWIHDADMSAPPGEDLSPNH